MDSRIAILQTHTGRASLKRLWCRFTRTASVLDLRTDALAQQLRSIRRRAESHYYRHGFATAGRAVFA